MIVKRCKVRRLSTSFSDSACILESPEGMPLYWPNLYTTGRLLLRGVSSHTIFHHLSAIGSAIDWLSAVRGCDFDESSTSGVPLLYREAKALGDFLKFTAKRQREELSIELGSSGSTGRRGAVRRLDASRPVSDQPGLVGAESAATAIRHVCHYFEWLYQVRRRTEYCGSFGKDAQAEARDGLVQLRAQIPKVLRRCDEDERLWSIEPETLNLIESMMAPESGGNPWSSEFVRHRNHLLWRLLVDTGGRRGEVCGLRIADFDLAGRLVTFLVSKTIPRTVPISQSTVMAADRFIRDFWSSLPAGARRSGYVFTSTSGDRLTTRSVNLMFEAIRNSSPDIPDWLSPHTLRRTWNETFSRTIDSLPEGSKWSPDKESKVRTRLMGWVPNSTSASSYLRRHVRRESEAVIERMTAQFRTSGDAEGGGDERNG